MISGFLVRGLLAAALLSAGACAQTETGSVAPRVAEAGSGQVKAGQPYELTKDEKALDCRQLTGRMQVRILQTRDSSVRGGSSSLARGMQSAITPVLGGTDYGKDPEAQAIRDRAVLEALNKQLTAKGCATFDLDAEMQPRSVRDTPTPVPGTAKKS